MMRASELTATAKQCEQRADKTTDAVVARFLRQRARHLREIAVEVDLLERDPLYRTIRDRPGRLSGELRPD
jgi:hypothetical protein